MRLPPTGRQSSLNAALDLSASQPILDCPAWLYPTFQVRLRGPTAFQVLRRHCPEPVRHHEAAGQPDNLANYAARTFRC